MNDPTSTAISGAAGSPLSREQKTRLSCAAAAAHRAQIAAGCWSAEDGAFDDFRHGAAFDACGVASFRAMQQRHYLPALLHFQQLAGRDVRRRQDAIGADDSRRALAKLRQECADAADCFGGHDAAWNYAEALARKIHKTNLASANPKQVWQVIFTLRNRAAAIRRKGMLQDVRAWSRPSPVSHPSHAPSGSYIVLPFPSPSFGPSAFSLQPDGGIPT